MAPHGLLQAILRRGLPSSCTSIDLMRSEHANNLDYFLQALGRVYDTGATVLFQNLYPKACYPVPKGTPMISPLFKWDHSQSWYAVTEKELDRRNGGVVPFTIDATSSESKVTRN